MNRDTMAERASICPEFCTPASARVLVERVMMSLLSFIFWISPTMRRLTRKMLEEHGYKVLEAEDGKSALQVIGSDRAGPEQSGTNKPSIDLILTDVVMKA